MNRTERTVPSPQGYHTAWVPGICLGKGLGSMSQATTKWKMDSRRAAPARGTWAFGCLLAPCRVTSEGSQAGGVTHQSRPLLGRGDILFPALLGCSEPGELGAKEGSHVEKQREKGSEEGRPPPATTGLGLRKGRSWAVGTRTCASTRACGCLCGAFCGPRWIGEGASRSDTGGLHRKGFRACRSEQVALAHG